MSILKLPLLFVGSKGERHLSALFDAGAHFSCIHPDCVEDMETPVHMGRIRYLSTASTAHVIEVTEVVRLDFIIDDIVLSDEFLIVPGLTEEVIIGVATLQKWRLKLDFEHDRVIVNPNLARMQLKRMQLHS
jgi:predicted aspartyl protease